MDFVKIGVELRPFDGNLSIPGLVVVVEKRKVQAFAVHATFHNNTKKSGVLNKKSE